MRNLGAFVSVAGGLQNGIANGEELGVNTIMMHPSPPQRWCTKPFDPDAIKLFNEARKTSNIQKVHMHGIYLINLANPDKQKFHLSKMALVEYLNLAEQIDAEGVVFHTGSFKDIEPEAGFERIAKGIDWVFSNAKSSKPLLLEVAAGAGRVVGSKFEDLQKIDSMVKDSDRVHYCLDTQHLFASGYDLVNDVDGVIKEVDEKLGLEYVKCIHFNDSKTEFNSNRDRHENIGEGKIGELAMKKVLNHPKLRDIDFVMETPNLKDPETAKEEVKKLLGWAT